MDPSSKRRNKTEGGRKVRKKNFSFLFLQKKKIGKEKKNEEEKRNKSKKLREKEVNPLTEFISAQRAGSSPGMHSQLILVP